MPWFWVAWGDIGPVSNIANGMPKGAGTLSCMHEACSSHDDARWLRGLQLGAHVVAEMQLGVGT